MRSGLPMREENSLSMPRLPPQVTQSVLRFKQRSTNPYSPQGERLQTVSTINARFGRAKGGSTMRHVQPITRKPAAAIDEFSLLGSMLGTILGAIILLLK